MESPLSFFRMRWDHELERRHREGAAGILPAVLFSGLPARCRQHSGVHGKPPFVFSHALGPWTW